MAGGDGDSDDHLDGGTPLRGTAVIALLVLAAQLVPPGLSAEMAA